MPRKKRGRARRPSPQADRSVRPPQRPLAPPSEPGIIDRLKKNPFSVLLGVIVVGSMILALAGDIFLTDRRQEVTPTPTEALVIPTSAPTVRPPVTATATVAPTAPASPTIPAGGTPAVPGVATLPPPGSQATATPAGSPTIQPSPTR